VSDRLKALHGEMSQLLAPYFKQAESYGSIKLVDEYRQYWRPDNSNKVNVILLAESHVFTTDIDRQFKLNSIDSLPDYPKQYAKFVYCLAYGEASLTEGNTHPAARDGTPQFWKILFSCVNKIESNKSFSKILKSRTKNDDQRILNKIELLKSLQDRGIWLVDASVMALYNSGEKPPANVIHQAIRASWLGYTQNVIQEANPDHIIVVGKGVAEIVEPSLRALGKEYTVIPQPNARLSAEEHLKNYKTYYRLCNECRSESQNKIGLDK
jgi:hypothetical protein